MADNSKIEWTDATWNPVTGCTKVSPGCDNCYAETFAERWRGTPGHHFENGFDVVRRPGRLDQPLKWKKPRRIFVNSMSDLFHDQVPDRFIGQVFETMAAATQHTFQLLTKRHGRMRSLLRRWSMHAERGCNCPAGQGGCSAPVDVLHGTWPLPNVWLGTSVETQKWADIRIPALLETPAAVRFLSCEPLLGPVNLAKHLERYEYKGSEHRDDVGRVDWYGPRIGWVIVGGESGPGARPMHPDWARSLRDQCVEAGVAFHFKQHGAWAPYGDGTPTPAGVRGPLTLVSPDGRTHSPKLGALAPAGSVLMARYGKSRSGRVLDGRTWDECPASTQEMASRG